jgi:hypothetical protein
MLIESFLDTNILIYGATGARDEPRKAAIARQLIATQLFGVTAQTLAEFYKVVSKQVLEPLSLSPRSTPGSTACRAFPLRSWILASCALESFSRDATEFLITTARSSPRRLGSVRRSSTRKILIMDRCMDRFVPSTRFATLD